jgi:GT2 family glycosyltransferase
LDKKIFVVIVTYNGAHWIDKNIPSLLDSAYPVNIIVVDNKSTDNTLRLLKRYPEIDVIKSEANLGFGKANNIGMQRALSLGADYLFLLNQDAWIFKDTISVLVAKMQKYPKVGLQSPLHFSANTIDLDQSFATYYGRKTQELDSSTSVVPFVNAAAWMLSKECVNKVGFFEPLFGHYGEDRNYCDRIAYHKFLIAVDSNARIVHDRVIIRNFNKDVIQSKFKILATLLNVNCSIGKSYMLGLKEALGLPKYFSKFYGWTKASLLLFKLIIYYLIQGFNLRQIIKARNNAK